MKEEAMKESQEGNSQTTQREREVHSKEGRFFNEITQNRTNSRTSE